MDAVVMDAVVMDAVVMDAVVLAGGRASRMGHQDKATLRVRGDRTLLEGVLAACADARAVVLVGPARPAVGGRPGLRRVRESPPGGGPVAALAAGLAALPDQTGDDVVLVLAVDLPFITPAAVAGLVGSLAEAGPGNDGAVFVDADGRRQPLAAVYRRRPLTEVLAAAAVAGRSMGSVLAGLRVLELPDHGAAMDCDTPADVELARSLDHVHRRRTVEDRMDERRADGQPADGQPADGQPTDGQPTEGLLQDWVDQVCSATGVEPAAIDVDLLLGLAKDAAHRIARPAAPLTTFLAGYLAGRALPVGVPASPEEAELRVRTAVAELTALIARRSV